MSLSSYWYRKIQKRHVSRLQFASVLHWQINEYECVYADGDVRSFLGAPRKGTAACSILEFHKDSLAAIVDVRATVWSTYPMRAKDSCVQCRALRLKFAEAHSLPVFKRGAIRR